MDVYETESEFKSIPILPQLISLGINHSLCISRTNASANSSRSRKKSDDGKQTASYLNVLSWGKVPFNCLGQGVEVNTSEFPRVIPFFSGRRVTQVSCGDYHSAVLVCSSRENINAGTVFTFGLGNSGRLGYHIDTNSEIISQQIGTDDKDEPSWCTPVPQPVGMSIGLRNNVVTISCGANHTLVTTADGYLYAWGVGAHGVLGNGSVANRYIPVKVIFPQDTFISKCAAGARHSMALDIKGNIWSWGYGGNGRLGLGSTRSCFTPNLIEIFDTYEVFQISCGDSHSACLDRFGTVYTWGSCRGGKLGLGNILSDVLEPTIVQSLKGIHIIQVSCGSGNTLALSSSGKIYQWGSTLGFNKQTDGLISHTVYSPEPVAETGFKNIFVTSGPYSFAAINIFGDLLTWGLGTGYRLGHGDSKDHVIPKFVSYLRTRVYIDNLLKTYDEAAFKVEDTVEKTVNPYDERRIQQIAVGDAHGALLTCNGTVYTWGANNGTGCNSTTEPLENYCEPILFNHFSSKITKIACGSSHTLAVTINGLLFSWGSNESGQLGHGDLRSRVVPDSVSNIENCINVFAGIDNSGCICSVSHENMMKDEYGTLWVFGSSTCGKLGLGENMTSAVMTPREVNITGVHSVALGPMHSLALTSDGTLYAAGAGSGGRLGTGNTTNSFTFVQVKTDHKFVAVGAGASHSLAISMENDLYGWGEGKYLTFDEDVLEPTIINTIPSTTGQAKVVALAVAANHSLVLSQSGNLSGFGDNSYGQLGVFLSMKSSANNFIKMPLPVNVQGNIVCVATSRYFSSCSNLGGDAFSWGLAKDHRLGIGETKSKIIYKPTPIANTSMIGDLMDKFELDSYKHTSMSGYETILNYFLDELHYSSDPHSINWRNLQIVLKNEEKITSEASIKLFEEDLVKCLKTHVDFILSMSESYGRVRALQFKLLSMVKDFCTALRGQKEINTKPGREFFSPFKAKLTQIEKLVEILFLQPAYFVRLAMFSHDLDLVSNIVHHVYGDIQVPRVHNQYFALLRSLLREETALFFKPTNPLNAFCSPFSRILRTYAMNKYLIIENAHLFLSQTDQQSVVSHLATYSSPILIPQEGFEYKDHKRYKEGMCRFGSFLVFLATVLSRLVLHNNIKLLFTQMYNLVREKIPVDWASPAVPLEYLAIFPLIPVFVFAIIQPFFTNPNHISQMCGLGVMGDENVLKNMCVISTYFDYIVNPELKMPPMPAVLTSLAQTLYSNLSRLFLEYLRSILHVEDNFYTDLTMQIFKSHFDTDYVNVSIPSDTVAKLVNLCHSSSHYLNFSAHDPLVKIISGISGSKKLSPSDVIYPTDFVEKLSKSGLTNFRVDHRFMVYDRNMSFCAFSNTFVPQKLAYRQSTFSEDCVKFISVIVRYVPLGKYDPCKILQDSLTQLDDLRVQYGTYDDLTDEMFLKSKYFSSLSSPDFKRADIAKEVFNTVQKLKNDITPTLVGKSILKKCLERIRHRKYLLYIYQHQNEIEQCRRNFEAQISYNVEYLNSCINSLHYGHIDPAIKRAAIKHRVNLFTINSNVDSKKADGKKSYGKRSDGKKSDGKSVSFREYSCLELYRNGTLVPDDSVATRVFNRLVMAFSASIDTGCYITLRGIDHSDHKELEFLSFELLQKFVDSSNSGYHQIFTNPSYPSGMFVIKASFLVDTFMALVRS